MFYAQFVLSKKGPLAKIWLAAHWEKKLTKAHVYETNINNAVDSILEPKVKMALRTTGHLLLGIVRIYSRKAKYLLADCNEAFIKIKMAFRPGVVDMPEEGREANLNAITLPEVFHDFDSALPDFSDMDYQQQLSANQCRREEITIREDIPNLSEPSMFPQDDEFGDAGFDSIEFTKEGNTFIDQPSKISDMNIRHDDSNMMDVDAPADDDFGGQLDDALLDDLDMNFLGPNFGNDDDPVDDLDFGGADDGDSNHEDAEIGSGSVKTTSGGGGDDQLMTGVVGPQSPDPSSVPGEANGGPASVAGSNLDEQLSNIVDGRMTPTGSGFGGAGDRTSTIAGSDTMRTTEQTTLIQDDLQAFALEPLDTIVTTINTGYERNRAAKRKRKLVVDEVKSISGEDMKNQLSHPYDTVASLDIAPPTKKLMHWKETGNVDKLFNIPSMKFASKKLLRNYSSLLITRSAGHVENPGALLEDDVLLDDPNHAVTTTEEQQAQDHSTGLAENSAFPSTSTDRTATMLDGSSMALQPIPEEYATGMQHPSETNMQSQVPVSEQHQMEPELSRGCPVVAHDSTGGELVDILTTTNDVNFGGTAAPPTPGGAAGLVGDFATSSHLPPIMEEDHLNRPPPSISPCGVAEPFSPWVAEQPPTPYTELEAAPPDSLIDQQQEELVDEEPEQEGESEEAQEKRWNKRTQQVLKSMTKHLRSPGDALSFKEFTRGNTTKLAAQKFYTLLVLKKWQAVEFVQPEPFGDIMVTLPVSAEEMAQH